MYYAFILAPLPDLKAYKDSSVAMMRSLAARGHTLCLPVVIAKGRPLAFRAWAPGDPLERVAFGLSVPRWDAPPAVPDFLLVPLLAFDRRGFRLGYGGGYFDRTLRDLRQRKPILAVGLGLDELEVDAVPHLDYDQRLDWVLTPSGPRRFER
mgnify:CR=1 FL=1